MVGKQWWWEFQYPDAKVVTANELHIPVGRKVALKLKACDQGACNVIHSFWVPELVGHARRRARATPTSSRSQASEPGTYLGQCEEYCGLSHANMRFRVIAQSPSDFDRLALRASSRARVNALDGAGSQRPDEQVTLDEPAPQLIEKFQCTNCHTFDDSSADNYGPNLTHLASRTTFASGYYKLEHARTSSSWLLNAPGLIPMESQDCRDPVGDGICVGMPIVHEEHAEGLARDDARRRPTPSPTACWSRSSDRRRSPTTQAAHRSRRRAARRWSCGARRRPPGSGAGSPPSTTRRSASCTAAPRWSSSSSPASRRC